MRCFKNVFFILLVFGLLPFNAFSADNYTRSKSGIEERGLRLTFGLDYVRPDVIQAGQDGDPRCESDPTDKIVIYDLSSWPSKYETFDVNNVFIDALGGAEAALEAWQTDMRVRGGLDDITPAEISDWSNLEVSICIGGLLDLPVVGQKIEDSLQDIVLWYDDGRDRSLLGEWVNGLPTLSEILNDFEENILWLANSAHAAGLDKSEFSQVEVRVFADDDSSLYTVSLLDINTGEEIAASTVNKSQVSQLELPSMEFPEEGDFDFTSKKVVDADGNRISTVFTGEDYVRYRYDVKNEGLYTLANDPWFCVWLSLGKNLDNQDGRHPILQGCKQYDRNDIEGSLGDSDLDDEIEVKIDAQPPQFIHKNGYNWVGCLHTDFKPDNSSAGFTSALQCSNKRKYSVEATNLEPVGYVERLNNECDYVKGWAIDFEQIDQSGEIGGLPIHVRITEANGKKSLIDSIWTSRFRPDTPVEGFHEFTWIFPDNLKDGQTRSYEFVPQNIPSPVDGFDSLSAPSLRLLDGLSNQITCAISFGVVKPIYRVYSSIYKSHFYTTSVEEIENVRETDANWDSFEGAKDYALAEPVDNTVAVHRFWRDKYKSHFFTLNKSEITDNENWQQEWEYEGVAFYAYDFSRQGSLPMHRFWSPVFNAHFYTSSESEKYQVENNDPNWNYEGIAFHVIPQSYAAILSDEVYDNEIKASGLQVASNLVEVDSALLRATDEFIIGDTAKFVLSGSFRKAHEWEIMVYLNDNKIDTIYSGNLPISMDSIFQADYYLSEIGTYRFVTRVSIDGDNVWAKDHELSAYNNESYFQGEQVVIPNIGYPDQNQEGDNPREVGLSLIITDVKMIPGSDGWVTDGSGLKQWVSMECAASLKDQGVPVQVVSWDEIVALSDSTLLNDGCDVLVTEDDSSDQNQEGDNPREVGLSLIITDVKMIPGSDGWVTDGSGLKQWVSMECAASLKDQGVPVQVVSWDEIVALSDSTLLNDGCDVLVTEDDSSDQNQEGDNPREVGLSLIITDVKMIPGSDGWVTDGLGLKQWVSMECAASLKDQGVPVQVVSWDEIVALSDSTLLNDGCDVLVTDDDSSDQNQEGGNPREVGLSLIITDVKMIPGSDGWVTDGLGLKQWVSMECAASLKDQGVPVQVVSWDEIVALSDSTLLGATCL